MRDYLILSPKELDRERLARLQKRMQNRKASICSQRALLYTESFQQTEQDPYILRKAKAFAHTLTHMDIYLEEDSLIFGNQASRNFAAPIFPEYSIDWVIDELDTFEKRQGDLDYRRAADKYCLFYGKSVKQKAVACAKKLLRRG